MIAIVLCLLVAIGAIGFIAGIMVERHYNEELPNPAEFVERGSD